MTQVKAGIADQIGTHVEEISTKPSTLLISIIAGISLKFILDMSSLRLDIAVALRFLFHRKAAFLVIVLTIGSALAANTTAFSVVHGFLFANLAIPHSDRVVVVSTTKILPGRGVVDFSDAFP